MTNSELGRLVLQSHSGKEFRDAIAHASKWADYRAAIEANYEPHPLLAAMTYTGERGVVVNALEVGLDEVDIHNSGLQKAPLLGVVNSKALDPEFHYVASTANRLDLEACGDGLIVNVVNAGRAALAVSMLDQLFRSTNSIWTAGAVPIGTDDAKPLGYRRWVVGGSSAIQKAARQAGGLDALTASLSAVKTIGLPLPDLPDSTLLVLDPSALYWCGQRDAVTYVDDRGLRARNQIRIITEQAFACWYDPNRVQAFTLNS